MASLVRIGITKLVNSSNSKLLATPCMLQINIRNISSKALRSLNKEVKKPKPWPYEKKGYNIFHSFFDKTSKRFDENTKV